ncbi:MAG: hypothetical protein COA79_01645 [Planctomycetota bacterium]|nr:MAG: hypothetical protein COA79_01645 [Planctomycetota bacterium]
MKKMWFSIIELMAVIVVILILMTLFVPTINKVRKRAKTLLCGQQLKQLGVLNSTYALDNNGYLPFSYNGTLGWLAPGIQRRASLFDAPSKGALYGSWSGHLLPYFDVELKTWNKGNPGPWSLPNASTYDWASQEILKTPEDVADPDKNNWRLLQNMYFEGGHGPLKTFVCPEIHDNPAPRYLDQGYEVPNMYGIVKQGYSVYGLPTTYKANGEIFGNKDYPTNSMRIEDINKKNILLLEGGHASYPPVHPNNGYGQTFKAGQAGFARFFSFTNSSAWAANNLNNGKKDSDGNFKTGPETHTLYMHDDSNELWISDGGGARNFTKIVRFNKVNAPYAAASGSYLTAGTYGATSIATSVYPGEDYGQFNPESILNLSFTLDEKKHYYREDIGAASAFGYMNILLADLSVKRAFIGWIYENGRDLGTSE